MAFTIAAQGVMQGKKQVLAPLLLSCFRLVVFVFPFVYLFSQFQNPTFWVWWSFPIGEIITDGFTILFLLHSFHPKAKEKVSQGEAKPVAE